MHQHGNYSFAPLAIQDLLSIRRAAKSEGWNPGRLLRRLRATCDHVASYPVSGSDMAELSPGLRAMSSDPPAHNYVICFRKHRTEQQVEIVAIIHGARDWQAIVKDRLDHNP